MAEKAIQKWARPFGTPCAHLFVCFRMIAFSGNPRKSAEIDEKLRLKNFSTHFLPKNAIRKRKTLLLTCAWGNRCQFPSTPFPLKLDISSMPDSLCILLFQKRSFRRMYTCYYEAMCGQESIVRGFRFKIRISDSNEHEQSSLMTVFSS